MTLARITDAFAQPYPLIIPYITLGDPDLSTSRRSIITLARAGAGMIELGLPFSDPVADGPTIQKSSERALQHRFGLNAVFEMTKQLRDADAISIPFVLMSYANPIYQYGFDNFCRDAVANGIDAALITDMPPEESADYLQAAKAHGLGTVFLCSPTTSPERLKTIDQASTAFVYYVARTGVTGAANDLPGDIGCKLTTVRQHIPNNRLCAGFGISKPEHVHNLAPYVDGLIVGSALVQFYERYTETALQNMVQSFTTNLVDAARCHVSSRQPVPLKP